VLPGEARLRGILPTAEERTAISLSSICHFFVTAGLGGAAG
jgi:hypothetical protein